MHSTLGMNDQVSIQIEKGRIDGVMLKWDFDNPGKRIIQVYDTLERGRIMTGIWEESAFVKVAITRVFS